MGRAQEAQRRPCRLSGVEPRRDGERPHLLSPDRQRPEEPRRRDEAVRRAQGGRPALLRSRNGRRRSDPLGRRAQAKSEEHTSELQSLMRNSYAVFCLKKKTAIQQLTIKANNIITHNNKITPKLI